jgi:hypothetical protein
LVIFASSAACLQTGRDRVTAKIEYDDEILRVRIKKSDALEVLYWNNDQHRKKTWRA